MPLTPLTDAAEGIDWKKTPTGQPGQNAFEALTPQGAVFLAELATLGFFGPEMIAAVEPSAVSVW